MTFGLSAQFYQTPKTTTANYSNPLEGQFIKLLQKHSTEWQKQEALFTDFEKSFFSNVGFMQLGETHGFFTNLQEQISNGNFQGNFVISYTNATFVDGKMQSVSYTCSGNGKNAQVVKMTNNNGQILKAVYDYDMSQKQMKVQEYKNKQIFNKKEYSI